jgi:hypothetical protein
MVSMKRFPVSGVTVYEIDICAVTKDHDKCPGFTMLFAGDLKLGPVACKCSCHAGEAEAEVIEMPQRET